MSADARPAFWARDSTFQLALLVAALIAYTPALNGAFLWDDDRWTTGIAHLLQGFDGLVAMWSDPFALQQFHPLTGTSFWLDHQFFGFAPLPYHVENVLLHGLAAILFWRLLDRLRVPGAKLAAALFALHPVMVESVAWVTERKNVLSLALFLGALLAYGRSTRSFDDEAPGARESSPPRRGMYLLALALFVAAMLAKALTLTLPAVILLVAWWKRGRLRWKEDVRPALPFFAPAVAMGIATAWLEQHSTGSEELDLGLSPAERLQVAGRVPWFYLGKLLWPANLCFVYPQWQPDERDAVQWLGLAATIAALSLLWFARRRTGRGPLAAVLYFLGTLSPLMGFVTGYGMRYSFVWDHWVYLSGLSLFALGAALVALAAERFRSEKLAIGFATVVLPVLLVLTWRQSGMYKDGETLWRTTLERNPACWMGWNNLGVVLSDRGDLPGAIALYRQGLEIEPDQAEGHVCLGAALFRQGAVDEALVHFRRSLEIQPKLAMTHYNLGNALLHKGRHDEAIAAYLMAIELKPAFPEALVNLGLAYQQIPRMDEAIRSYRRALDLRPELVDARVNLAVALAQTGRRAEALVEYRRALELQPNDVELLNSVAWVLATSPDASVRSGAEAESLARRASALTGGGNPWILQTLAAALAENRKFAEALSTAEKAAQAAAARKDEALADAIRRQAALYRAGSAFRESGATPR